MQWLLSPLSLSLFPSLKLIHIFNNDTFDIFLHHRMSTIYVHAHCSHYELANLQNMCFVRCFVAFYYHFTFHVIKKYSTTIYKHNFLAKCAKLKKYARELYSWGSEDWQRILLTLSFLTQHMSSEKGWVF